MRICLLALLLLLINGNLLAQNVFNASDPVVRYNATASYGSAQRPDTNLVGLQKWVANLTNGVSSGSGAFDNSSYKPYFINYGSMKMAFRLKYPKSFNNPDSANKKYPVMLFMHGAGEVGCTSNGGIYNNEKQLVHGGKLFMDRVDNNQFDGFLLYPQINSTDGSCWGEWGGLPSSRFNTVITIVDSLVKYARLDIDRVFVDGLSGGGIASWRLAEGYPTRIASIAPTSAAGMPMNFAAFVHIPIWLATGGKDTNPSPAMALYSEQKVTELGGNIRRSLYEDLGHSSWYRHWQEADFVPYMNAAHKANPLVFFGRSEFCPDSGVNARLGVTAGFYAYEWEKDGQLIASKSGSVNQILQPEHVASFTGNEIVIKAYGTYRVRFRRVNNGDWSSWSPRPAVIKAKTTTQTPPIAVTGMRSSVLPSPDGKSTVTLQLPQGFTNYQWVRTTDNVLVSTSYFYEAPVGSYKARYSEAFGCGTVFSPEFTVVNANGSPKPDAAKNLNVMPVSQTTLRLDWNENPNAGTNETGFEVYRSAKAGGPYSLVNITVPDVTSFLDTSLVPNTSYFYVVRAVSTTGAAPLSNEANGKTEIDDVAPSAPSNLEYRGSTVNSVNLRWNAAADNAAIGRYDIYANGVKMYSTQNLFFSVGNLDSLTTYTFYVKAVDKAGNVSPNSNQVTAYTHRQGLNYKYYHGSYSTLPDFNSLTPVKTGITDTVNTGTGIRTQDDNFAFMWQGRIYIPVSGTYTFETFSDDGSKLYIDVPYTAAATALVNNDGAHSARSRTGSIYLAQGYHDIVVTYAEVSGNQEMMLYWWNNAGLERERIPKNFLAIEDHSSLNAPVAPSSVVATALAYNKIQLSWSDMSGDETAFEIVRSSSLVGAFAPVFTTRANVTTFVDSSLAPATRYYYKVRAVGVSGESAYTSALIEGNWRFNDNYEDANGGLPLVPAGTDLGATDKAEGSHAAVFSTGDYISFGGNAGDFPSAGGYSQRTVSLWLKPTATNNRRMIFDFGGNDNGMALKFNNNDLVAGAISNSTRGIVVLPAFTNNANWRTGQWNHVAVVYNGNSLLLYLNGQQVAVNQSLSFTRINNSTNASRIGMPSGTTGSNNVFNDNNYTGYQGAMDNFIVVRGALSGNAIQQLMDNTYGASFATTLAAPPAPAKPSGLTANVLSTNAISLAWNDNSNNETGFEIWRSSGDKTNNRMVAKLQKGEGGQLSFTDSTLFANVTYYYQVRATGEMATSEFSEEVAATTLNTRPVLKKIVNFTIRYGTTYTLPVTASDVDGDALTFSTLGLPTFAALEQVSNGNMNIVFSPPVTKRGSYPMTVIVADGNNGSDSSYFTLTVNTNDVPVMTELYDTTLNEGTDGEITFSATDNNGTASMMWSFEGLPSFATFTNNNDGSGRISFKPGYSAAGEYNITVIVNDGYGAWTSNSMLLTVVDRDPEETVQFNFRSQSAHVPLWNSVNIVAPTFSHGAVVNVKNKPSTISLSLVSGTIDASMQGPQTGNNTGVYPDLVMKDMMRWGFSLGTNRYDTIVIRVSGLEQTKKYSFIFYAGYNLNGVSTSQVRYRIGNETAAVNYYLNTRMTDTIENVIANTAGEVFITMIGDPNTNRGGLLNAMVVRSNYDDGSAPAKPGQLTATNMQNKGVQLKWQDRAFNEWGYRVYRSTSRATGYQLLNDGQANQDTTSFLDAHVLPEATYYYYVVGFNGAGTGTSSDTVKVMTENNKPKITIPENVYVKAGSVSNVTFEATDDTGDVVTVTMEDSPAFVRLEHSEGPSYRLVLTPTNDHLGWFTAIIKAADQKGAVAVQVVRIGVNDKNTRSAYVNFGSNAKPAPSPWNNFTGTRTANSVLANLKDETNSATNMSITMLTSWSAVTELGHITGNNSGIYPDAVLASGISDGTSARSVKISGLDNLKKYNIVIIGSQNEGTNSLVEYSSGTVKDTLNAKYNMHQSANLNGLTPVDGQITFSALRLSGTSLSVMNALVIEEYDPSVAILNPLHLFAEAVNRTAVDLSWTDRTIEEAATGGYVLERAADSLFSNNLVAIDLPANTTTYRDGGLTQNTRYWYRVRAKSPANAYSDYSNRAGAITAASTVYMNFNYTLPDAEYPWNNTFTTPNIETTFENLINHRGVVSGVNMSIMKIFNGEFTAGMNTGNNSGVVPDKALASNYWIDNTQQSQIKLSGLNHSRRYRVGFFGSSSSAGWFKGNYTATYTVNGTTVYLNSWMNSTKVVYIDGLKPDENGELLLDFSTTEAAAYGFNGGLIIEDYTLPGDLGIEVINPAVVESEVRVASGEETVALTGPVKIKANLYPNPFTDVLNMEFYNASGGGNVSIEVHDLSGRLYYRRAMGKMPEGRNTIKLNALEANMTAGVYFITLTISGKKIYTAKAVRVRE